MEPFILFYVATYHELNYYITSPQIVLTIINAEFLCKYLCMFLDEFDQFNSYNEIKQNFMLIFIQSMSIFCRMESIPCVPYCMSAIKTIS